MGGGLMQLVAYGAQDIYLTGNPQITFFKVVYRRHTNFAMESIQQTLNGSASFGGTQTATISRNGDLLGRMYVQFSPQSWFADSGTSNSGFTAANLTHTLLKEVEIEIGGQMIDKHYGHWLTVYNQLTEPNYKGEQVAHTENTGAESATGSTLYQKMSFNHIGADNDGGGATAFDSAPTICTVPLQFWFCRNPGLALPLIALQYHEVNIKLSWCDEGDIIETTTSLTMTTGSPTLWSDYIYLDTDERRRFAQVSHEYLIEQLQFSDYSSAGDMELNFNHPVKELIWTGAPVSIASSGGVTSKATPAIVPSDGKWSLKINGHERFESREYTYFTRAQVWQHHTGFGGVTVKDSIAVYSFALKPEEHQPSGTCNFSRIDNAVLKCSGASAAVNVYAVNYNVLRVMSGMGGLAYSN